MCKTHKIAKELDVNILKQLRGAEVLDVPEHGELEDAVYLVEKEGEKFVLKTGNFNPNEIDDNWELAEKGIQVQRITESQPGEYILYEYIDAPLLAQKDFWSDANMQRVFGLHKRIEEELRDRPITQEQRTEALTWIDSKVLGEWLKAITGSVYSSEQEDEIRQVFEAHKQSWEPVWVYSDNNAEHYVDLGDELAVLDARIDLRPEYYMDMRYLTWVILRMPIDLLDLEWVRGWVEKLGGEKKRLMTFLVSLIGILWDIHANEKHKGHNIEKTEKITEIVDWVVDELQGSPSASSG